jgi:hypothetical protein
MEWIYILVFFITGAQNQTSQLDAAHTRNCSPRPTQSRHELLVLLPTQSRYVLLVLLIMRKCARCAQRRPHGGPHPKALLLRLRDEVGLQQIELD